VIVFQGIEAVLAVEHRHEFAAASTVAAQADPFITRQVGMDILELMINSLLRPDEVGRCLQNAFAHHRPALRPGVGRTVAGVAQVERHDTKRVVGVANGGAHTTDA